MGANVAYRSQYWNTTDTGSGTVLWRLEILDTDAVGGIINFESTQPDESFEGLTQNLIPGVYPSMLKFGMFIRDAAKTRNGTVFGPSSGFIDELFTAKEGRFLARYWKIDTDADPVLQFVGPIIIDECSFEDSASPYLLNITAADGLFRLQSSNYISQVGLIKSFTCFSDEFTSTPVTEGLEGSEWVLIEHISKDGNYTNPPYSLPYAQSSYARYEQYSANSPGAGWVDQGNGLWAKEVTYTNEVITSTADSYHLRRDFDYNPKRTISELIQRAIDEIGMSDEYDDVMYDTSSEWYEESMPDTTSDPFQWIRVHEGVLQGRSWTETLTEVCISYNVRAYYSKGRYHFEQISTRDEAEIIRWAYSNDGTLLDTETVDLDLDFSVLEIEPETSGLYKILAPLKKVEVSLKLEDGDLLKGQIWQSNLYGTRYLGTIKRAAGIQTMRLTLKIRFTSSFDYEQMAALSDSDQVLFCQHIISANIQCRIVDKELASTYFLTTQDPVNELNFDDHATWETVETEFKKNIRFTTPAGVTFSIDNLAQTREVVIIITSDDLPGVEGAMYDIYFGLHPSYNFLHIGGALYWLLLPFNHHHHLSSSESSMVFLDGEGNEIQVNAEKTYFVENEVDNSFVIKYESQWGDSHQYRKSVEVWNGTKWVRSRTWESLGSGTSGELLSLLVSEIMSFRTLPRRLFSGSYVSSLPNAENRLIRATRIYLPLSCSKNTDYDTFQGEFLEIDRTEVNDPGVIEEPTAGGPTDGPTGDPNGGGGDDLEPIPMVFETNEIIFDGVSITEVDILNTLGVFVQAGTQVKILHPETGVFEYVYLTEDVNPDDTVMYFQAYSFVNEYPDASWIIPKLDAGQYPTSLDQVYYYFKQGFTGSEISAPNFTFLDPEQWGYHDINKRYTLFRNGTRIFCKFNATDSLEKIQSYYFNNITKKWLFYAPGLENETIEIHAF